VFHPFKFYESNSTVNSCQATRVFDRNRSIESAVHDEHRLCQCSDDSVQIDGDELEGKPWADSDSFI